MMTDERIKELRRLCEAATPGPWDRVDEIVCTDFGTIAECYWSGGPKMTNAEFIAVARTALPELLDEIERLQDEVTSWEREYAR